MNVKKPAKQSSPKKKAKLPFLRRLAIASLGLLALALLAAAWVVYMLQSPLARTGDTTDFNVSTGKGARAIARELAEQGLNIDADWFVLATRIKGADASLKAGRYEIPTNLSLLGLVDFLSAGQGVLSTVALIEGHTAAQMLTTLRALPDIQDDLAGLSDAQLAAQFDVEGASLEGWLYPDTFKYSPGSRLSTLVKRAVNLQKSTLQTMWEARQPNLPLRTPYEALKLASIIEKETGLAEDRPNVSSVFINRLRIGMLLQTDPTVIYGLGDSFNGNLTRAHLRTDTPYNTYTRAGLPPTPIANPGRASIHAALHPPKTPYFYFVAKGDGSSYFSKNLDEHNSAVRRYILRR